MPSPIIIQPRTHWPWWRRYPESLWAIIALLLVVQIVEAALWI